MISRAALAVGLAALVAAAPAAAPAAWAASTPIAAPAQATDGTVAAPPKVVIVVGPTESTTASYINDANSIAATALKYTPNVVKIYSPNATWTAVSTAAQGASIFVDLGHGWGFPSPYTTSLAPNSEDGMALNAVANQGDSNRQYYGESYIAKSIRFAPGAVVFLNHLCYAPGASEPGNPDPTIPVAQQRVDNFASGYIRAGARAVIADDGIGTVEAAITSIFTTHQSMLSAWRAMPDAVGHEIPWTPARNPAFQAVIDPTTWTSGFLRSIVTDTALTTDAVLAGAQVAAAAPSLTAPGAASVTTATPLYTDQSLDTATGGTLATATTVRVDQVVASAAAPDGSTPPPAVQVNTLDGVTSGWVTGANLTPLNSTGPQLWSMTGPTAVSPNFDGVNDQLALWARLSEPASWTAQVLGPDKTVLQTLTGTSDLFPVSWNGLVGGNPAPAGTYGWTLHASDALGNPALDTSGSFDVVTQPVPTTGLVGFTSLVGNDTNATSLAYQLTFATSVSGLTTSGLTLGGTATSCVLGAPSGSGTTWYVSVTGCSAGTVTLTLDANSVVDASQATGPAGDVAGPTVVIDRTKPTTTAPGVALRAGVTLGSIAATAVWSGSDTGGAGVASYDVARSVDGATFAIIAGKVASPSLNVSLSSGHSYRFEVRTRDRAGNVSGWAVGPTLSPALVQQTSTAVTWTGTWATASSTAYSGGSARTATAAGASATYSFTGRQVAAVMSRDPSYGQVKVYLDGVLLTTIDTRAASHANKVVVYAKGFAYGSHKLKLVVVGTAGRPRVVLDAFEVIR